MLWMVALLNVANAQSTVAVTTFDAHSVRPELQPLGLGLSDMLITDLQRAPSLRLVERRRLQEVLREFDLAAQGYLDESAAARLGEGLGAHLVVTGSITVAMEGMRLDARVVDVATGRVTGVASAAGAEDQFFALENQLATSLLRELGAEVAVPVRDLSLDQAITAARRLGEADVDYLRQLDGTRRYKLQRMSRGEYRYQTGTNGAVATGTTWTVYEGGGQWIGPPDFAGRVGLPDLKQQMKRRRRTGKIVYWSSLIGGSTVAVGSTLVGAGRDDGIPILVSGMSVGLGGVLVGGLVGYGMQAKTTRHTSYWTANEVDDLIDESNRRLAEDLGLSETDRLNADVSEP